MKRILQGMCGILLLAVLVGCACDGARLDPCGRRCGGPLFGGRRCQSAGPANGAGTGVVAYPYYTLHGPRDFLQRTPTPIGP